MTPTYTSPEDQDFFAAIGRLTLAWAHLELGLDCTIHILHRDFSGSEIQTQEPRALTRKLAYLRDWVKQRIQDPDAVEGYNSLLASIEKAAQTRHDIIHGIVVKYDEGSGEANFKRLIRSAGGPTFSEFTMTTVDILTAALEAQRLGGKTLFWANQLGEFASGRIPPDGGQMAS